MFRLAIQILFFVLLPALYVNAFSGLQQIYLAIIQQNFDFTLLLPQIVETVAILPATVLLERFFCGWMCAFGTLGDMIYRISQKIFRTKFTINPDTDRTLKKSKIRSIGISSSHSVDSWNRSICDSKPMECVWNDCNGGSRSGLFVHLVIVAARFGDLPGNCNRLCFCGTVFLPLSLPSGCGLRDDFQTADS